MGLGENIFFRFVPDFSSEKRPCYALRILHFKSNESNKWDSRLSKSIKDRKRERNFDGKKLILTNSKTTCETMKII